MLGDGLLSEQLENDGPHQIPLVLKLQGPLVLEERGGMGGVGGRRGWMKSSNETAGVGAETVREDGEKQKDEHEGRSLTSSWDQVG